MSRVSQISVLGVLISLTAIGIDLRAALLPVRDDWPPTVNVRTIEATYTDAVLESYAQGGGAVFEFSGDRRSIPVDQIVSMDFAPPAMARFSSRVAGEQRWLLTNGDSFFATVVSNGAEAVVLHSHQLGTITIPLERIGRVDSADAVAPEFRDSVMWFDRIEAKSDDLLVLTNGDLLRGLVSEITSDGIQLDAQTGPSMVPHRLVVSARLANPMSEPSQKGARIELVGGARLTLRELRVSEGNVSGRTADGSSVEFDDGFLDSIEPIGGRWQWLADLDVSSASHVPMLNLDWGFKLGANVLAQPIRVAGKQFEHGIGVHSRSSLVYALSGEYAAFETHFGLDDSAGPLADVDVFVHVDGKPRYARRGVTAGELFGPVRIDVSDAKRIELFVDYGENGDVQDRFNWVEPGLVRGSAPRAAPLRQPPPSP
jgi:hypothetical protein